MQPAGAPRQRFGHAFGIEGVLQLHFLQELLFVEAKVLLLEGLQLIYGSKLDVQTGICVETGGCFLEKARGLGLWGLLRNARGLGGVAVGGEDVGGALRTVPLL